MHSASFQPISDQLILSNQRCVIFCLTCTQCDSWAVKKYIYSNTHNYIYIVVVCIYIYIDLCTIYIVVNDYMICCKHMHKQHNVIVRYHSKRRIQIYIYNIFIYSIIKTIQVAQKEKHTNICIYIYIAYIIYSYIYILSSKPYKTYCTTISHDWPEINRLKISSTSRRSERTVLRFWLWDSLLVGSHVPPHLNQSFQCHLPQQELIL